MGRKNSSLQPGLQADVLVTGNRIIGTNCWEVGGELSSSVCLLGEHILIFSSIVFGRLIIDVGKLVEKNFAH